MQYHTVIQTQYSQLQLHTTTNGAIPDCRENDGTVQYIAVENSDECPHYSKNQHSTTTNMQYQTVIHIQYSQLQLQTTTNGAIPYCRENDGTVQYSTLQCRTVTKAHIIVKNSIVLPQICNIIQ